MQCFLFDDSEMNDQENIIFVCSFFLLCCNSGGLWVHNVVLFYFINKFPSDSEKLPMHWGLLKRIFRCWLVRYELRMCWLLYSLIMILLWFRQGLGMNQSIQEMHILRLEIYLVWSQWITSWFTFSCAFFFISRSQWKGWFTLVVYWTLIFPFCSFSLYLVMNL